MKETKLKTRLREGSGKIKIVDDKGKVFCADVGEVLHTLMSENRLCYWNKRAKEYHSVENYSIIGWGNGTHTHCIAIGLPGDHS